MPEETYLGPCGLLEALAESGIAVSVPHGEYVAMINLRDELPSVRRLHRLSGRGGSVLNTGEWLDPKDIAPSILWRPG